jgi:hypothetical protein
MALERDYYYVNLGDMHDQCQKHMYYHVTLVMTDGSTHDGIIENVDDNNITMLVGENVMEKEAENEPNQQRQYGGYGHFYNRPRFMRYRRRVFPFANLAELALLPYIAPPIYPYPYPYPYPYYPL